nr:Unknown Function [uncultured bacterium]
MKIPKSFEDTATKFFEHFVLIAEALNEAGMWNEEDKFFYDTMSVAGAEALHLRIFSIVGLTSLFAVSTIEKRARSRGAFHLQFITIKFTEVTNRLYDQEIDGHPYGAAPVAVAAKKIGG